MKVAIDGTELARNTPGGVRRGLWGLLDALHEQGQVKVVSQPKIRTLNNQSALIKVGTDRTFFRRELLTDTTSAGSTTQTTDVPQVVTARRSSPGTHGR